MKLTVKFPSMGAVSLMCLFRSVISSDVMIRARNKNCGSVSSRWNAMNPLWKIVHSVPMIPLILAILLVGCYAKVVPSVIVRVPVLVVGESSIGNLLPHQGEDDSVGRINSLNPLPVKFYDNVSRVGFLVVSPCCYSSRATSDTLKKASMGIIPLEMRTGSLFPNKNSRVWIIREALLQILPRWERFYQIHSSVMDLGALFGVSPVGAPLSLLHVKPTFN